MKYPNAAVGSREIFVGEILMLIFSVFTSVGMMLVFFAQNTVGELVTGGTLTAISIPFTIVWYYMYIGFIRRSKKMLNKQKELKLNE